MKITLKGWVWEIHKPKHFWNKITCVVGIVMALFGLWQMDMICVGPVWFNWHTPDGYARFADFPFEMGRVGDFAVKMTVGTAYDLCQVFIVLGLALTVISLWFWDD